MKKDDILSAIGEIDEKYISRAKPTGTNRRPVVVGTAVAASLALVVGVALGAIILGGGGGQSNPSMDYPYYEPPMPNKSLASVMEDYVLSDRGDDDDFHFDVDDPLDGGSNDAPAPGDAPESSNGSYVEVTDNQIEGIIEGDLYKTTDKYIFRYRKNALYIYSIDGENSREMSVTPIGDGKNTSRDVDMFLSEDGNTVSLIQQKYVYEYYDSEWGYATIAIARYTTYVYSIDVSDVESPKIVKTLEVSGQNKAVRKIGDKIYLVTLSNFSKRNIDIDDPATYTPGITNGEGTHLCEDDRIYYPEQISKVSYVYLNLLNEADLSLVSEYAVLNDSSFSLNGVYFTDNHIVIDRNGTKQTGEENGYSILEAFTILDLIKYSGESFEYRGGFEMRGFTEAGQYSYDEQDGYLRVVSSTRAWSLNWSPRSNASVYVFDLSFMTLRASVEDFAPEGECATAVRFDGNKLYVCTAETAKFNDPVFFFDLSDYDNITQVNTGYIDGFSTALIDIGEGYLVGIGREDRTHAKIEVYKREGESVVSVAEYLSRGYYDSDYHAYLIDRENNLIGLALTYINEGYGVSYGHGYFLLRFDPETESLSVAIEISSSDSKTLFNSARAFVRDGYLYLTSVNEFNPLVVKRLEP